MAVGLIVLIWSVDGVHKRPRKLKSAFWRGFVFAMGYFLVGTFWVGFAFINRGPEFIPLIPIALPAFAAILAVFWGGAMVLYAALGQRSVWRILGFAASIAVFEWLRGHLFSGLPWNLPAYIWEAGGAVSQAASWFGVYGLSLLTVLMLVSPAVAVSRHYSIKSLLPALAGLVIFLVLFSMGSLRLATADVSPLLDTRFRIVQLAITQAEKWGSGGDISTRDRYLEMTALPGLDSVTHVLWPEGALPTFMLEDVETLRLIGEVLPADTLLLSGVNRREVSETGLRYYNSLAVMDFSNIAPQYSLYDKVRLVPFGETVPFVELLAAIGFEEFARLQFSPGPGPAVLEVEGAATMMPLICYEAIFPNFVNAARSRPDWLFNLSNDAWFGDTSGPRQHLNQARYRSIETGLPLIRSASRGISGVIDPLGRMPVRIGIDDEGAHDVSLPRPLAATIYVKWGDTLFWIVVLGLLAGIVIARRNRRG